MPGKAAQWCGSDLKSNSLSALSPCLHVARLPAPVVSVWGQCSWVSSGSFPCGCFLGRHTHGLPWCTWSGGREGLVPPRAPYSLCAWVHLLLSTGPLAGEAAMVACVSSCGWMCPAGRLLHHLLDQALSPQHALRMLHSPMALSWICRLTLGPSSVAGTRGWVQPH